MGKITGFKEFDRATTTRDPVADRLKNYKEFEHTLSEDATKQEGARCMDCGIPFCHGDQGCPVDNLIPEFNDLVYHGHWKDALDNLHSTNNFPEFTGRLCPAPCEGACTLGITDPPVYIKSIERSIIDRGFAEGLVEPKPPEHLSGKKVAVVGSGPAGMAASQQLARAGHSVTLYEKNDRIGGLLRYGIPDFKMEKWHIDRRMEQMKIEGVKFKTGVNIGVDVTVNELLGKYEAVVLAGGSEAPRDLPVEGRQAKGVHFAMDFLTRNNKKVAGDEVEDFISAKDKHVIVIGGGDTGSDCVGTSNRHGAKSVTQLEIFGQPPEDRPDDTPWPLYPRIMRTSSSHEEGADRKWSVSTKGFKTDADGNVTAIFGCEVKMEGGKLVEVPDTEFEWPADLVLLAMGFVHPTKPGLIAELEGMGLELDGRGNVKAHFGTQPGSFRTSVDRVYACGDMRRGQSLIVWAISEGRKCAAEVHRFLSSKVSV